MTTGQITSAALNLIAAVLFIFVGYRLMRHYETSPEARPAMRWFGFYWLALGLSTLVRAALLGWAGVADSLPVLVAWSFFVTSHALILVGIAGFMYYAVYIFTGRVRAAWTAFILYAAFGLGQLSFASPSQVSLQTTEFRTPFYSTPQASIFPFEVAFVIALLPAMIGTVGLLTIGLRAGGVYTRYRALMIGGALLFWFASIALEAAVRIEGVIELLPPLAAALAATAVYQAYFPTLAVEQWLLERDERRLGAAST